MMILIFLGAADGAVSFLKRDVIVGHMGGTTAQRGS